MQNLNSSIKYCWWKDINLKKKKHLQTRVKLSWKLNQWQIEKMSQRHGKLKISSVFQRFKGQGPFGVTVRQESRWHGDRFGWCLIWESFQWLLHIYNHLSLQHWAFHRRLEWSRLVKCFFVNWRKKGFNVKWDWRWRLHTWGEQEVAGSSRK